MGEVYRAMDTRLHRTVAIKILPQHLSHDPERQQQFRREAQINGRSLAYIAVGKDGIKRLWLRRFDGATARAQEIPGTEDANSPFWSPDSEWVGFFSRQRLLKLHVSSARVQIIAAKASTMAGATWNADGVILFPAGPSGLWRVSADGGPLSPATSEDGSHFWPQFMADGRHFLLRCRPSPRDSDWFAHRGVGPAVP